ncbi:MAG: ring-cleaving dioxygenase [Gemmatimonadetes bacterium]|nr:ring-cleaving dioxygenase [Gemmatimonadota bacterium]
MQQENAVHGIHHVTALAGDPQRNLDFYVDGLGLRLVKRSVNQDDPATYHLFYADAEGTPGTDLTFFPQRGMAPGRPGVGQVGEVPLAIPAGALEWWRDRLVARGVWHAEETTRFGERTLAFRDPDGLPLALVEIDEERRFAPWAGSPVPAERQIRGVHAVRIRVADAGPTVRLLEETMGFDSVGEDAGWRRWVAGDGSGAYVDLAEDPDTPPGRWGSGAVHHVAWRVRQDEEQDALREAIVRAGLRPTQPIDRFWFRSVYFREPGGTLFELATDGPGFDRDERPEALGESLVLPPWLEEHRERIEAALPALEVPASG